jgi:hypothetical protein
VKVVEETPGHLLLEQSPRLTQGLLLVCMLIFALLAVLIYPTQPLLGLGVVVFIVLGSVLVLMSIVRTTVSFDRIHQNITIRRRSFLRDRRNRMSLRDITGATLTGIGGSILALQLRPGLDRQILPIAQVSTASTNPARAVDTINRWLQHT